MILNDVYSIEEDSGGFVLIEKREGKDKEGNPRIHEIRYFYGVIYQALLGFLRKEVGSSITGQPNSRDNVENLHSRVEDIVKLIEDAETEIKKNFKIEVLVTGRGTKKEGNNEEDQI